MAHARIDMARRLLSAKDVAGARRECTAVLAGAAATQDATAAHLILAECARRDGNGAKALTHAQKAVDSAPADAVARYALAELLEASGHKTAALEQVRQAVALDQRFVQAWNYLGILAGESGDNVGAATAFAETVRLDPQRAT